MPKIKHCRRIPKPKILLIKYMYDVVPITQSFLCVWGSGLKWKRKKKRKHDVYTCVEEDQNVERITSPLGWNKPCGSFFYNIWSPRNWLWRDSLINVSTFTNVSVKYAINVWTSFLNCWDRNNNYNMFTFIFRWFCVTNVTMLTWLGICIHTYVQVSKTGQYTCTC